MAVARRELRRVGRGPRRRKGEMSDKTGDQGTDGFEDAAGEQGAAATHGFDEVQRWKGPYDRDAAEDGLD